MTNRILSCEALDELFPDYLEGTLGAEARGRAEAHLASCARCGALARDLAAIRRSAATLPELRPSRDLWAGIAERIEAPVIELSPAATRPRRRWSASWMAVAAAGLVFATAVTTYYVTVRVRERDLTTAVSGQAGRDRPGASTSDAPPATLPPDASAPRTIAGADVGDRTEAASPPAAQAGVRVREGTRPPADQLGGPVATLATRSVAEGVYDREIERLRRIVAERRDRLDPATVAVLERNLEIIDAAIAQSRAALSRDPGSAFLTGQLTNVLDKKLELLRTAARLPTRT
jgi:hypothetical protein